MTEKDFLHSAYRSEKESGKFDPPDEVVGTGAQQGKVSYRSPSNIALIKYWGKKKDQIPANPSVSFTLNVCATETSITYRKLKGNVSEVSTKTQSFDLLFEGKPKEDFKPKIATLFKRTEKYLPFLKQYHLAIDTSNSFPHSSGIASSASGMSALALCLVDMERQTSPGMDDRFFKKKASFLARLGSGSACRSIEGELVQWGLHAQIEGSSDLYGIKYPYKVHNIFHEFQDTILLVDQGQKQVSSSLGHGLMHGHPFAEERFAQAHRNLSDLRPILEDGNLSEFIKIVESEALTLHAMMMSSRPYFILMKPNTLKIIQRIRAFRESSKAHVCFTLDAGANVHVLYPKKEKEQVYPFIRNELLQFCEDEKHILDSTGTGAKKLNGYS